MADYSELKRKAQEIKDEVKAGANTANRVGLALEETVNALEEENQRATGEETNLGNDIQRLQDETEDLQSMRDAIDSLGTNKADKTEVEALSKELAEYIEEDETNVARMMADISDLQSNKQDTLSPGDGITMKDNIISTLIGDGLAYNGKEMVVSHDTTLRTTEGKLGVNAGIGLFVNPDNKLGVHTGKGLAVNHADGTVEVAEEVFNEIKAKAPKVGYAPDLKVSYAEELVGRGDSTNNVIARIRPTSGKETSIKDGNATIERIKGESVVWNQLIAKPQVSGTILADRTYFTTISIVTKRGVYYIKCHIETNAIIKGGRFMIWDGVSNTTTNYLTLTENILSGIIEFPIDGQANLNVSCNSISENQLFTASSVIHNLTQMFGAGNEPTTIEEFEARKPLCVTNEYNEGTIVSFQGGDVKSVGFNAWDEEWELGGFFNGEKITAEQYSKTIRSKNYIPVIGGCEYFVTSPIAMYANFFDKQYKYIKASSKILSNTKIVVPSNAAYMWIRNFDNTYGTTYNHDICIHLVHSGYRNGEYEPYVNDVHSLPDIKSIKDNNGDVLFPYGLLSAGNVHDEITATKAIKRVQRVVLNGSENWALQSVSSYGIANFRIPITPFDANSGISDKFTKQTTTIANTENEGFLLGGGDSLYIRIKSTTASTVEQFKAWLSQNNVIIQTGLAEPIEVDLTDPLNMTYEAWDFGTEELIAEGATTPLNADIAYMFNAVDRIRENSKHVEESEKKLTAMEQRIKSLENMIAQLTINNEQL